MGREGSGTGRSTSSSGRWYSRISAAFTGTLSSGVTAHHLEEERLVAARKAGHHLVEGPDQLAVLGDVARRAAEGPGEPGDVDSEPGHGAVPPCCSTSLSMIA